MERNMRRLALAVAFTALWEQLNDAVHVVSPALPGVMAQRTSSRSLPTDVAFEDLGHLADDALANSGKVELLREGVRTRVFTWASRANCASSMCPMHERAKPTLGAVPDR